MTVVLTKDIYYRVSTDKDTGSKEFDLLSFKFLDFPTWIRKDSRYVIHEVKDNEAGMLDLISYNYFGTEAYWWVIAVSNYLLDPVADVVLGKRLLIPRRDAVAAYVSLETQPTEPMVIEL